jgi:hypothetical protein
MMLLTLGSRMDNQTQNDQVVLKTSKQLLTVQQNQ